MPRRRSLHELADAELVARLELLADRHPDLAGSAPALADLELAWSLETVALPFFAAVIGRAGGFRPLLVDAGPWMR
jgi:hypothetical protein